MKRKNPIKGLLANSPSTIFIPVVDVNIFSIKLWHIVILISCLAIIFVVFPYKEEMTEKQEVVSLINEQEPPSLAPHKAIASAPIKIVAVPDQPQQEQITQNPTEVSFGLHDEAIEESDDLTVATGNTLSVPSDSVVNTVSSTVQTNSDENIEEIRKNYITSLAMLLQERKLYPWMARRLNQQGTVNVRFCIEKNGLITNISITGACPYEILNEGAKQTVEQLRVYKPIPEILRLPKLVIVIPIVFALE